MKSLVNSFIVIGICCCVASSAIADDIRPPDWRGWDKSTLQDWDYLTGDNPLGPDGDYGDQNPYGVPNCSITVSVDANGNPQGYWDAESSSLRDGLWAGVLNANFDIQNNPDENLEKWVRVQVMYREVGPHLAPSSVNMTIDGVVFDGSLTETVTLFAHGFGWKLDVWDIAGAPNPMAENVDIVFPGANGGLLDHVVIDTICIPEPATVMLLGVSGLVALLRRRRS